MSHGQATRSTLGRSRVTHFMVSSLMSLQNHHIDDEADQPPDDAGQPGTAGATEKSDQNRPDTAGHKAARVSHADEWTEILVQPVQVSDGSPPYNRGGAQDCCCHELWCRP